MKKINLIAIIPMILMGIVSCGGTYDGTGEDVLTPVEVSKLEENLANLESVTLNEHLSGESLSKQSLGEGLPSVDTFQSMDIVQTAAVSNNGDTASHYEGTSKAGYSNLSKLAKELNISRDTLIERLKNKVKYFDLDHDRAVLEENGGGSSSYEWFSSKYNQKISYEEGDRYPTFSLDEAGSSTISEIKDIVNKIIDEGVFDKKTSTYTIHTDVIGNIFELDTDTVSLYIEHNYPKRLTTETDEYKVSISLSDYNKTTVSVPSDLEPAPCEHNGSRSYKDYGDIHRMYCTSCRQFLAPQENHQLLDSQKHQFCTRCGWITNLVEVENEKNSVKVDGERVSYFSLKKSKTNNNYYTSSTSFYYHSGSKRLIATSDLLVEYWPDVELLLVKKAYDPNDNSLTNVHTPEEIKYACYKATKYTYEAFSGVKASEHPSLMDGTFTRSEYPELKRTSKLASTCEVYYINVSHGPTATSTDEIDPCHSHSHAGCGICGEETYSYYESNHAFDDGLPIRMQIDECHYELSKICTKCNKSFDADNYGVITGHKNATYKLLTSDHSEYMALKYGITSINSSHKYIEVNCPTCKEEALYEISSSICSDHLNDKPSSIYYGYFLKDGKVSKIYNGYIEIPHKTNDQGICEFCGKNWLIVKVSDGVKFLLYYSLDSSNNVTSIYYSEVSFESATFDYQDLEDAKQKRTYYKDNERTQVICSLIESTYFGRYIELLNSSGTSVYKAEIGQPLPKIS